MTQEWFDEAMSSISENLEVEVNQSDSITEEDLLLAIAGRVANLMDSDAGLLFSYLYRLDISEANLSMIINQSSNDPIAYSIAKLILERQKQRILTKKKYKTEEDLGDLAW